MFIHLLEASTDNDKAEPFADRLGQLAPGASHLVHMPSHTYMHTGQWARAAAANAAAVATDEADHVYPLHNAEFEVWCGPLARGHPPAAATSAGSERLHGSLPRADTRALTIRGRRAVCSCGPDCGQGASA